MNKDKALEELFLAYKPKLNDSDAFMASLNRRLDAVEYIRQKQETTLRRYKMFMVVAFIVGIVSGAITVKYVLSMPADVPLMTFSIQTDFFLWLSKNIRLIFSTALALLMSIGVISIVGNIQDIVSMRIRVDGVAKKECA